ncbi:MAG: ribosomal protein S18-alanine N-acetyltransferase [Chloroflexota bacterium]
MRLTESELYFTRHMRLHDVDQATEIDRECFPTLSPPTPFKRDLGNPLAHYVVVVEKDTNGASNDAVTTLPMPSSQQHLSIGKRLLKGIRHFLPLGDLPVQPPPPNETERIFGFIGVWYMVDEAHVTNIAVREAYRRCGIGELLLISAIDHAAERDAAVMTLEVRTSNEVAQALYRKYGFRRVGVRRHYYSDDGEDAIIMTTERITSASFQQDLERLKLEYRNRWGPAPVQCQ